MAAYLSLYPRSVLMDNGDQDALVKRVLAQEQLQRLSVCNLAKLLALCKGGVVGASVALGRLSC